MEYGSKYSQMMEINKQLIWAPSKNVKQINLSETNKKNDFQVTIAV